MNDLSVLRLTEFAILFVFLYAVMCVAAIAIRVWEWWSRRGSNREMK